MSAFDIFNPSVSIQQNCKVTLIIFLFLICPGAQMLQAQDIDYSNPDNWAALPTKFDPSDLVPGTKDTISGNSRPIDVFFLYPTSYTAEKVSGRMNADIDDYTINQKTDRNSIKFQASVFNRIGNIYAPRYRQSHISAYFMGNNETAQRALAFAYKDVEQAFLYFLKHYNQNKPFILAGHSQGATHLIRLIKDHIAGTEYEKKLIVAYIVGMPATEAAVGLKACKTPEETQCFCSWRTFKKGYVPEYIRAEEKVVVTNPITWTMDDHEFSSLDKHVGALLFDFDKGCQSHLLTAKVQGNVLWVTKPRIKGRIFLTRKNYHIGDINLFYNNIQDNAALRSEQYFKSTNGQ